MSTKNKKLRRFNPNEDKLIINEIKNNPTNLSFAFKNASRQLVHRTPEACSSRYYTALRNSQAIIAIGSEKGLLVNTKNTRQTVSKDIFNAKLRDDLLVTAFSAVPKEATIAFFLKNMSEQEKNVLLERVLKRINKK